MAVVLGSNTVTGVDNLTVSTTTTLNGAAFAVTPPAGANDTRIATTTFVDTTATRPVIDFISVNGYNSMLIRSNGKVYEAHGVSSYTSYTSGRCASYDDTLVTGFEYFSQVPIPSPYEIVKCFLHGPFASALDNQGNLYMWGYNGYGQLGLGDTTFRGTPTLSATNVADVYWHNTQSQYSTHESRMIIKKTDGYLYTAGYNGYGQLGLGDTTDRSSWTQITAAGTNPLYVGNLGGNYGSLVIQKSDKTIWMCGYNGYGQLGTGNGTNLSTLTNVDSAWRGGNTNLLIRSVHAGLGYATSSAASYCSIGLFLDDGTTTYIRTSGANNWGDLGTGDTTDRTSPYTAWTGTGTSRVEEAAWQGDVVGGMMIRTTAGNLYGWGYNGYGQLGAGDTGAYPSPTLTATGVTKLWGDHSEHGYGHYHTSFMQKADGLYSTGYNSYGELGNGISGNRASWAKVKIPQNAHNNIKFLGQNSTTGSTRCYVAVTNNNTLYSWGYNGQYMVFGWNGGTVWAPTQFELMRGD
jgi:alpha-tubulin suppressor-like RCC1 family protein